MFQWHSLTSTDIWTAQICELSKYKRRKKEEDLNLEERSVKVRGGNPGVYHDISLHIHMKLSRLNMYVNVVIQIKSISLYKITV